MSGNSEFLQALALGNTLGAAKLLRETAPGGEAALALNQLLYGPASDAALAVAEAEQVRTTPRLNSARGPERTNLVYNLGCLALFLDDVFVARSLFTDVVKNDPTHGRARHNLAYALELLAESGTARREYTLALQDNPDSVLTRINLALLDLQEGQADDALRQLFALNGEQPGNSGVLLYLCRALLERGSPQDIQSVVQLVGADSRHEAYPELRECRAFALYLLGQHPEAEAAFSALLQRNEGNLFARMGLIKLHALREEYPQIKHHAQAYLAHGPHPGLEAVVAAIDAP